MLQCVRRRGLAAQNGAAVSRYSDSTLSGEANGDAATAGGIGNVDRDRLDTPY